MADEEAEVKANFDDSDWTAAQDAETSFGRDPREWLSTPVVAVPTDTPGDEDGKAEGEDAYHRDSAGRFAKKDQEPDDKSPATDALDPNVLDMARRVYDLSDEELDGFTSTHELERALRLIDRRAAARTAQQNGHVETPQMQQAAQLPAQGAMQQVAGPDDPFAAVDLSEIGDDDPLRKAVDTLIQEVRSLREFKAQGEGYIQAQQQAESQRIVKHFVDNASKLLSEIDPAFYGKPGERTQAQQALVDEASAQAASLVTQRTNQGEDYYALDLAPFVRAGAFSRHWDKLERSLAKPNGKHPQADAIKARSNARSGTARRNPLPDRAPKARNPDEWLNSTSDELLQRADEVYEAVLTR